MALIKCIECGKKYSDKAEACPECACPTSYNLTSNDTKKEKSVQIGKDTKKKETKEKAKEIKKEKKKPSKKEKNEIKESAVELFGDEVEEIQEEQLSPEKEALLKDDFFKTSDAYVTTLKSYLETLKLDVTSLTYGQAEHFHNTGQFADKDYDDFISHKDFFNMGLLNNPFIMTDVFQNCYDLKRQLSMEEKNSELENDYGKSMDNPILLESDDYLKQYLDYLIEPISFERVKYKYIETIKYKSKEIQKIGVLTSSNEEMELFFDCNSDHNSDKAPRGLYCGIRLNLFDEYDLEPGTNIIYQNLMNEFEKKYYAITLAKDEFEERGFNIVSSNDGMNLIPHMIIEKNNVEIGVYVSFCPNNKLIDIKKSDIETMRNWKAKNNIDIMAICKVNMDSVDEERKENALFVIGDEFEYTCSELLSFADLEEIDIDEHICYRGIIDAFKKLNDWCKKYNDLKRQWASDSYKKTLDFNDIVNQLNSIKEETSINDDEIHSYISDEQFFENIYEYSSNFISLLDKEIEIYSKLKDKAEAVGSYGYLKYRKDTKTIDEYYKKLDALEVKINKGIIDWVIKER